MEPRKLNDIATKYTAAQGSMTAFLDSIISMNRLTIVDERISYYWTLAGTNTGPGRTGKLVHISGYEEWRFGGDCLIAESKGHFDVENYERQLKAVATS